ncbi:hypothetical protein KSF_012590 [Reticulibacter mediterranei]|uniref:DUF4352 domain-containing protein n=2 Tax=Reticulibacter mediterranei TaxID=2778369 RepID=A0A8J3IB90_9CHLR|nr:hypothetical protein KSF_012590 [Reticulibacter mediterranei]
MIIVGLVISGVIALIINYWLNSTRFTPNSTNATTSIIATLDVQRASLYAGLEMTIKNAQSAQTFVDDTVPSSSKVVRLNMHVANPTNNQISLLYYEIARLLAPHIQPIAPLNVHLSAATQPGKEDSGWIDFPFSDHLQLDTLTLQLGSSALHETMVLIPLKAKFDPKHFITKSSPQSLAISYNFNGNLLSYYLKSVDVAYAYQGRQARAGQQFYVLHFLVDNPNGVDASPGLGYDYIRLVVLGYSQPPIDSTLSATFKHATRGMSGNVVFVAPVGMKTITVGFRSQFGGPQQNYVVRLMK